MRRLMTEHGPEEWALADRTSRPHCFHQLMTMVHCCHCGKATTWADWVQGTYSTTCRGAGCGHLEGGRERAESCRKPAQYLGRTGESLCTEHALEQVGSLGLQALRPEDRGRFLAENPGYAAGDLLKAG